MTSTAFRDALNAATMKRDAAEATTSWFDSKSNSHATGKMSTT